MERNILEKLAKVGANDYLNAFSTIPRTTRMLYLHALQSFIWNKAISIRIDKYQNTICIHIYIYVVPGDVIKVKKGEKGGDEIVESIQIEDIKQYSIYDIYMPIIGYKAK